MEEIIIISFGLLYILLLIGVFCISLYINCFKYYFDVGKTYNRSDQIFKHKYLKRMLLDTGQFSGYISNNIESMRYAYE